MVKVSLEKKLWLRRESTPEKGQSIEDYIRNHKRQIVFAYYD